MRQYEFAAKNVQEAIQKGLKELNQKLEDVDIKIISEGGLFSKAKIMIITQEEEVVVAPKKEEKPKVIKPEPKPEAKKAEKPLKEQVPKQSEKPAQKESKVQGSNKENKGVAFIENLAKQLGATVTLESTEDEENINVTLQGEKAGLLIGYRGEGLSAIQYLANVIDMNIDNSKNRKRIVLDIENYKQKREEALVKLAKRMATKAIETGKSQRLEPMNAYERRVIHAALTEEGVTTYSKGSEPRRFIVIEGK